MTWARGRRAGGNKYAARAVEVEGIRFASTREARRYRELQLLARAGVIADLELQPRWVFMVEGIRIGAYRADFRYRVCRTGATVVEDVKSAATKRARDYPLRKKLLRALFGIEVVETL
jgi:Protein of unknown function (DUF1064)